MAWNTAHRVGVVCGKVALLEANHILPEMTADLDSVWDILFSMKDKTAVVIGGRRYRAGARRRPGGRGRERGAHRSPPRSRCALHRRQFQAMGSRSLALTCDVTNNADLEQLLKQVCETFNSVEILVNCAGRTKRMPTLGFADSDWESIMK